MKLFILGVLVTSFAWASSCSVNIKNLQFCRDKGKFGAVCAYWHNAKDTKTLVPLSEWNKKRFGMVCTSEKGMGNINKIIETLCQGRQCVEKVNDLVKALEE